MKNTLLTMVLFAAASAVCGQNHTVSASSDDTDGFPLVDHTTCPIMISKADGKTVNKVAQLFAGDIERVTGRVPRVVTSTKPKCKYMVVIGTIQGNDYIKKLGEAGKIDVHAIDNAWERYVVKVVDNPSKGVEKALVIAGSDRRGAAYGTFAVSEAIGVSPWYWWADVPVEKKGKLMLKADMISKSPSVKYRGIFINDEDWGLKPWASRNFEKELGDIGPRTYAKVCELILRLKGNMLAPAMHSCTGAFYTHDKSKLVADTFGIIITTSHCEPLLLNNASKLEWDQNKDGDWNYATNKDAIIAKWEKRLGEASCFENIYTTAMRGLHDAGLRGNMPMNERVPLIERVIADQRAMLQRHKDIPAEQIPQIFVPYKETMGIYENGLKVPDDITLVWVDDNYGYMKRVSNPEEQKRKGGSGVYYHLSYLGAPHDYLWLNTTAPVLMYEELKKAYDTGADKYWLLNVGDIKPMELGMTTFMDFAWDFDSFDTKNINTHQAKMLARIFGQKYHSDFQYLLDRHYQLAWSRKPEFMGWEREWDKPEYTGLKDSEYSFDNYNEAQQRLAGYKQISDLAADIATDLKEPLRASFFEMVEYPVKAEYQMNRKFLMAQLNHELQGKGDFAGANWAASQAKEAYDSIATLTKEYNSILNGKWNGMMELAPGWCALYQKMPKVTVNPNTVEKPADLSCDNKKNWLDSCFVVDLRNYSKISNDAQQSIRLVDGIGYDWHVVQLGSPTDPVADAADLNSARIEYTLPEINSDSIEIVLHTVPFFPIFEGRSTAIGVSVDGCTPTVYENKFKEYSQEWKDQVLRNGDEVRLKFNIDKSFKQHTLTFICGDPGMMIQKVIVNWGGLKKSYLGPTVR